ncbi:MAG: class I SAM-dependent methyltransferase [Pseudomonadota bacterium]
MSDPETLNVYARQAGDYAALTDDDNRQDPCLTAFISDMRPGAHVLDLGCGPGASAAVMAAAGLRVDAFDPVAEMVALAAETPGVTARQAGFSDLVGEDVYDGIWANFSLLHAPRDEMPSHLARISRALRQSGRFHIAVKTGTGAARDKIGRFYTYYTENELTGLLLDARLTVFDRWEGTGTGLSGEEAHWIALAARG